MNDLSQLFELNPYVASGFTGQREAISQDMDKTRIAELLQQIKSRQQDATFKAQEHPFTLDKMRLDNNQLEAQIPGFAAESRKKGLEADLKAGTLQSDIDAGVNKNKTDIYKRVGAHLGSVAGQLEGVSDLEAPMVLSRAFDSLGLPPQAKQAFMERYSRYPASEIAKRMKADSDQILRENETYAQHYDTSSLTNDAHILINGNNNRTQKELEQMRIEAGKYQRKQQIQSANDLWQQQLLKANGPVNKYAAANAAAEFFRQHGETGEAAKYAAIAAELEPQARAMTPAAQPGKPGAIDVGGVTGLPTNPAASITPPSRAGSAPAPAANRDPMAQQAIQAWGAYEPNKYEYRMFNGKLQRKAK